jgi:hypothetical protein
MRLPLLALALVLAACGGGRRDDGPPEDEVLSRLAGSAHRALELNEPDSAAGLYARALTRARERDDAGAIGDMAFGQATAALAGGDAPAALRVAQEVSAELTRRGARVPPRLLLAEATALHRLGRTAEAGARATDVANRAAEDPPAALRAQFLLGLLAAGRGDAVRLAAARAALAGAEPAAFRADATELAAQEALLRGDAAGAAAQARAAAALRREAIDYRGLSRTLALEGRARAGSARRRRRPTSCCAPGRARPSAASATTRGAGWPRPATSPPALAARAWSPRRAAPRGGWTARRALRRQPASRSSSQARRSARRSPASAASR